ncbi:CRISP/Allergen/PR-1-like [Ornithodoros turicata]|uniref:CRISP/Allergen/PR-1-like n=1 Tax=Ornithodoros turicata TaxID=34597 RepID=UPI003139C6C9
MIKLEWNDELAAIAQAHAELCNYAHDNVKERFTTQFKLTGQNLATRSSTRANDTSDWPAVIKKWFREYKYAPVSVIRSFLPTQGRPIGHFTQVVWAKTRFVGCGYNSYRANAGSTLPYKKLYTCNYAKM